jgi:hypothetical protein
MEKATCLAGRMVRLAGPPRCAMSTFGARRGICCTRRRPPPRLAAGIDASQLILAGTHTHAGPGNYFGNTLYDTIVSNDLSGFHKKTADALAAGIAKCVNQAAEAAVPARLGVASAPVWYVSRKLRFCPDSSKLG